MTTKFATVADDGNIPLLNDDQLLQVDINNIHPSPLNPRKSFPAAEIEELAHSINHEGLIKSLLVRHSKEKEGCYEIIDGERRYRALQRLNWTNPVNIIIRNLTDEQTLSVMIVDNIQKQMLSPLEEASAFLSLIGFGESREEIAKKVGKTVSHVDKRLTLNKLIPEGKKMLDRDLITLAATLVIARETEENQKDIIQHYSHIDKYHIDNFGKLNSEDVKDYVEQNLHLNLKEAPFDIKSKDIYPEAGSCTECPKCTITKATLFDELHDAQCQDAKCYKKKLDLHVKLTLTKKGDKIKKLSNMAGGKEKDVLYSDDFTVCPDQKNPPKNAQKGIIIGGNKNWQGHGKGDVIYFTKKKAESSISNSDRNEVKKKTPKELIESELKDEKRNRLAVEFVKEAVKKIWTKQHFIDLVKQMIDQVVDSWIYWPAILDVYEIPYTEESVEDDDGNKKALLKKCKTLEDHLKLLAVINMSSDFDNLTGNYEPSRAAALKLFTDFGRAHKVPIDKIKKSVESEIKELKKIKEAQLEEKK